MHMKTRTTLSTKGQLVIPAEIRRRLSLLPGTRLILEWSGKSRQITVSVERSERDLPVAVPLAGSLKDVYPLSARYVAELRREADRGLDP